MQKEIRAYGSTIEVRSSESEAPLVVGHASVFNELSENLGGFREIILPGAFDDVLDDDVTALWNHDTSRAENILARTTASPPTLEVGVDARGLWYQFTPPDDARGMVERMKRGEITQSSFGFVVDEDRWDEDDDGRLIRSVSKIKRLFDVSPVVWGAYPQTDVSARCLEMVKRHEQQQHKFMRNRLARRNRLREIESRMRTP